MRFAVAADHAGFPLKRVIIDELARQGHAVLDLGTDSEAPVDYPDFARAIGDAVASGRADRGVLVCGSGVGASVAANKIPGIRCAVCHDTYSAHQGVEHDDMNVLALGARVIGPEVAVELVRAFAAAEFSGEERHVRRLRKVLAIEEQYSGEKEKVDG
ncbi:MAG TPA: ribose 5-phosphate isomerase B [Dehalococcoidia bacterium]|jgi:ribose 5-phosphate isomerase B|nr:ribose 5-phosphate isomerase B [Dehalococcoidia bacterium]